MRVNKKLINAIQEVAYHRNGICGRGFYAIRFTSDIEGVTPAEAEMWNQVPGEPVKDAKWIATVTDTPGECYVICVDLLETRGVKFGGNSWRGDHYEPELREAIKQHTEAGSTSGGVRVGPFCIPKA